MVVNTALILFLEAITNLLTPTAAEWTIKRLTFTASFDNVSYTTITDGALQRIFGNMIRGLVEVKKQQRHKVYTEVTKQESGEMVGWVKGSQFQRPVSHIITFPILPRISG